MVKRLAAVVFIFVCASVAWAVLAVVMQARTHGMGGKLEGEVANLWGSPQTQAAPSVSFDRVRDVEVEEDGEVKLKRVRDEIEVPLDSSSVEVELAIDHRRRGLLWYATYAVGFEARYGFTSPAEKLSFVFDLPAAGAVYDGFRVVVDGVEANPVSISDGAARVVVPSGAGQEHAVLVAYRSRGMDTWRYRFGECVASVRDFALVMRTDFEDIDFPEHSMSPSGKRRVGNGWQLEWRYDNLLSGVEIGMKMPQRLNPGPWAAQVIAAAPVSLFLFFFLLFMIALLKGIDLHPMHYFFLAAGFFSFHLLLAYLVDHLSIHLAFAICASVSVFLVISYMRLVVGPRLACVEVGVSQLVYLVLFSYTFFFESMTGLAITVLCIVTLFVVMQATGRLNWSEVFARNGLV